MDSEYDRGALSALTFCLSDFDLPLCQLSLSWIHSCLSWNKFNHSQGACTEISCY